MNDHLERIVQAVQQINQAPELHRHRLILVVVAAMQTLSFQEIADQLGFHYINVNFELSQRLLEVSKQQQPIKAFRLLNDEIIGQPVQQGLVLDHFEILFDPGLRLDPMRYLLDVSRYYTVVARWNGSYDKGYLVYAEPGHPEYVQYQPKDGVIISVESNP
ncbi:BREX-3 system P-loop-containing protein BrxF [Oscillatoria sp. FACHB-1407]|uniref:BREX-3 system P-loop-containing protein BrxF n=1 Tax=Oscillatoria sp. FACHB-1407 TaxID=2692847 RepID=UPI001689FB3D|nr:BREX-3 system P-loop-containing protein BrxF [Oscillatoria sp. FACHB-1407]MBD2463207.1 BREX-3 system P-loop-containing protein BrxF [Oscillatoria sp. FACHB-1407]